MPAKNPRITITLEPAFHATLKRLSAITGDSQSKLITGMLEGSQDTLNRLIQVLEAAQLAKDTIKGNVSKDIKETQTRMEAQLGLMLDEFDQGTRPLLQEVEAIKRRTRKPKRVLASDGRVSDSVPFPDESTPISNRGVRSKTNTINTIALGQDTPKGKSIKHGAKVRGVVA